MPDLFIIAGCNGAGKTTAVYDLLSKVSKTVELVFNFELYKKISGHD